MTKARKYEALEQIARFNHYIRDMNNLSLYNKINSLPENLKKEVQDFVELLQTKVKKEVRKKPRVFGSLKGKIKMTDDFDAPIEDFKDYM